MARRKALQLVRSLVTLWVKLMGIGKETQMVGKKVHGMEQYWEIHLVLE